MGLQGIPNSDIVSSGAPQTQNFSASYPIGSIRNRPFSCDYFAGSFLKQKPEVGFWRSLKRFFLPNSDKSWLQNAGSCIASVCILLGTGSILFYASRGKTGISQQEEKIKNFFSSSNKNSTSQAATSRQHTGNPADTTLSGKKDALNGNDSKSKIEWDWPALLKKCGNGNRKLGRGYYDALTEDQVNALKAYTNEDAMAKAINSRLRDPKSIDAKSLDEVKSKENRKELLKKWAETLENEDEENLVFAKIAASKDISVDFPDNSKEYQEALTLWESHRKKGDDILQVFETWRSIEDNPNSAYLRYTEGDFGKDFKPGQEVRLKGLVSTTKIGPDGQPSQRVKSCFQKPDGVEWLIKANNGIDVSKISVYKGREAEVLFNSDLSWIVQDVIPPNPKIPGDQHKILLRSPTSTPFQQ